MICTLVLAAILLADSSSHVAWAWVLLAMRQSPGLPSHTSAQPRKQQYGMPWVPTRPTTWRTCQLGQTHIAIPVGVDGLDLFTTLTPMTAHLLHARWTMSEIVAQPAVAS